MPTLRRLLVSTDEETDWRNLRGHLWLQESHYPLSDHFNSSRISSRISSEMPSNIPALGKHESHGSSNAFGILVFFYILSFASQFLLKKTRIAASVSVTSIIHIFLFVATKSTPLALPFASRVEIFVFF